MMIFAISLLPLIIWTIFSILYYGFPFPNTAYAKLNTGIDRIEILKQGIKYFFVSLKFDVITPIIILFAMFITLKKSSERKHFNFLVIGIIFNLFYIIYVGGDFMIGRFMSYSYLISVFLLMSVIKNRNFSKLQAGFILGIIVLYLFIYPHTPLNSPVEYKNEQINLGVADERGYYFNKTSLFRYCLDKGKEAYFPLIRLSSEGYEFKKHPVKICVNINIGLFGYWAGTEKIIIDPLALSDPLLARMPAWKRKWRIGHFSRENPIGYIESVRTNRELIKNKNINEFYKKIKIITQDKNLFSVERIKTILLMNLGWYDYLLEGI